MNTTDFKRGRRDYKSRLEKARIIEAAGGYERFNVHMLLAEKILWKNLATELGFFRNISDTIRGLMRLELEYKVTDKGVNESPTFKTPRQRLMEIVVVPGVDDCLTAICVQVRKDEADMWRAAKAKRGFRNMESLIKNVVREALSIGCP